MPLEMFLFRAPESFYHGVLARLMKYFGQGRSRPYEFPRGQVCCWQPISRHFAPYLPEGRVCWQTDDTGIAVYFYVNERDFTNRRSEFARVSIGTHSVSLSETGLYSRHGGASMVLSALRTEGKDITCGEQQKRPAQRILPWVNVQKLLDSKFPAPLVAPGAEVSGKSNEPAPANEEAGKARAKRSILPKKTPKTSDKKANSAYVYEVKFGRTASGALTVVRGERKKQNVKPPAGNKSKKRSR